MNWGFWLFVSNALFYRPIYMNCQNTSASACIWQRMWNYPFNWFLAHNLSVRKMNNPHDFGVFLELPPIDWIGWMKRFYRKDSMWKLNILKIFGLVQKKKKRVNSLDLFIYSQFRKKSDIAHVVWKLLALTIAQFEQHLMRKSWKY